MAKKSDYLGGNMICYHGTANYNLDSFVSKGIVKRYRRGHRRKAFCASLNFDESAFFALRKTPANDLTQTGVVLEFRGDMIEGKDYVPYRDGALLRDEQEICIFSVDKLDLVAYWDYQYTGKRTWKRIPIGGKKG